MEYKQLRQNFIFFLKEHYNYARPEIMASNVFYVWHNNIGIDFWEIFKSREFMEHARNLLIKHFETIGRKDPKGHAEVHLDAGKSFKSSCWSTQRKHRRFLRTKPILIVSS